MVREYFEVAVVTFLGGSIMILAATFSSYHALWNTLIAGILPSSIALGIATAHSSLDYIKWTLKSPIIWRASKRDLIQH